MKKMTSWGLSAAFVVMLFSASYGWASDLSSDEHVVFFPSEFYRDVVSNRYHLAVHGWVFEPETLGVDLPVFQKDMALEKTEDDTILKRRSGWFMVDNERGKELSIRFGGKTYPMTKTEKNGHFHTLIGFSPDYVTEGFHYSSRFAAERYAGVFRSHNRCTIRGAWCDFRY